MTGKLYDLVLTDPPWSYAVWDKDTGSGRSAESHYATMSADDIKALPIPAKKDAVLLLWACWPSLPQAVSTIEAWGFTYKTVAWVWVKATPSYTGFHTGMGYYTRANSEPCLLATRGKGLKRQAKDVLALIYSPVREHSRKPDEQYGKIDRLFGTDIDRLEMFARRRVEGWDCYGNEVAGSIEL